MEIANGDLEKITAPAISLHNFDDDVIQKSHAVTRERPITFKPNVEFAKCVARLPF